MTKTKRYWQRNLESYKKFQQKRNKYFLAIKKAKNNCWNNFLENAQNKDIFKAFQYTKQKRIEKVPVLEYQKSQDNQELTYAHTFQEKCQAFTQVLFKNPPASKEITLNNYKENKQKWIWPELSESELKQAIYTSSKQKAPDPDGISFIIIQNLYPVLKKQFYNLYKRLLDTGYHPYCWREATGVVLSKPNRNKALPQSYRIISLLNCLGKITEKIIAQRLAFLAETTDLLYSD